MRQPTEQEIGNAMTYLRQRLAAELSMRNNLESVMYQAVEKIIAIAFRYNTTTENFRFSTNRQLQSEVDEVIEWLRNTIEDYAFTLAVAEHESSKTAVIDYITRENHGKTFSQRNQEYCDRYKSELEVAIAAALLLGASQSETFQSVKSSMKHPFQNPYIIEAVQKSGDISVASYGRGHTNSMLTALSDLTEFAIAEGWMHHLGLQAIANGSFGFFVMRSSSHPCSQCDDEVGFHSDWDRLPPFHGHCKCLAVLMYQ